MQISLGPKRLRPCDIPTVAADLAAAFMAAGTFFSAEFIVKVYLQQTRLTCFRIVKLYMKRSLIGV